MAINVEISPVPVVHSAGYHVFVTGLVPTNGISVNTFQDAFADTPITGTADANGNFACAITAQATLGNYILSVTDTTAAQIVALTTFDNT